MRRTCKALFIGFMQELSLFPGISRSGSTIAGAKISGVNEKDALRFSFLIAIPTIIGAILLELKHVKNIDPAFLFIGFFTSFIISFPAILLLEKAVMKNKLHYFGYYCIFLSIITFCINFLMRETEKLMNKNVSVQNFSCYLTNMYAGINIKILQPFYDLSALLMDKNTQRA